MPLYYFLLGYREFLRILIVTCIHDLGTSIKFRADDLDKIDNIINGEDLELDILIDNEWSFNPNTQLTLYIILIIFKPTVIQGDVTSIHNSDFDKSIVIFIKKETVRIL